MQLVHHKELINLPVETKSGDYLGKIFNLEIDLDSQSIISYDVKYTNILKGILKDKLLISRNQIISISKERMIVNDNVLTEQEKEELVTKAKTVAKEPNIIQSKSDN